MSWYPTAWATLGAAGYAAKGVVYIGPDDTPKVDLNNFWYDELTKSLFINQAANAPAPISSSARKLNIHGSACIWAYNSETVAGLNNLQPILFFGSPRGDNTLAAANSAGDNVGEIRWLGAFGSVPSYGRIGRVHVNMSGSSVGNEGGQLVLEVKADGSSSFEALELRGGFFSPIVNGLIGLGRPGQAWNRLHLQQQNAGAAGDITLNTANGRVLFAPGAQTLTLTNSFITVNSNIQCTLMTDDATAKSAIAIPSAGSAVIKLNAAATGQTSVMFLVISSDV